MGRQEVTAGDRVMVIYYADEGCEHKNALGTVDGFTGDKAIVRIDDGDVIAVWIENLKMAEAAPRPEGYGGKMNYFVEDEGA